MHREDADYRHAELYLLKQDTGRFSGFTLSSLLKNLKLDSYSLQKVVSYSLDNKFLVKEGKFYESKGLTDEFMIKSFNEIISIYDDQITALKGSKRAMSKDLSDMLLSEKAALELVNKYLRCKTAFSVKDADLVVKERLFSMGVIKEDNFMVPAYINFYRLMESVYGFFDDVSEN